MLTFVNIYQIWISFEIFLNRERIDDYSKYQINNEYSQFSSVAQSCPTLCNSIDCSMPGLLVHHQLLELTQTHVHWVSGAIQPSHSLLSPSPPTFNLFQHQGLFKWVSSLHQVAKILEFQLQHQSFQWKSRTDFLQGLQYFPRFRYINLNSVRTFLSNYLKKSTILYILEGFLKTCWNRVGNSGSQEKGWAETQGKLF